MSDSTRPRVAVVGLGAIGSMTIWSLARRGIPVTGYDRYGIGHDFGASGGETRQFRMLYGEGTEYTSLLQESQSLWRELAAVVETPLFFECGSLTIGPVQNEWVSAVADAGARLGLPHEVLAAAEARERYPRFRLDGDDIVVVDHSGGIIRTHHAIVGAVDLAGRMGAQVHENLEVLEVTPGPNGVSIVTAAGEETFDQVVLCTGPLAAELVPGLRVEPRTIRHTWHVVRGPRLPLSRFPPAMRFDRDQMRYGTQPMPDDTWIKFGSSLVDNTESLATYAARIQETIAAEVDGVSPAPNRIGSYADGYTPDEHPLIGRIAEQDQVVVAVGMSGHGFKLAPAFGRLVADIVGDRRGGDVTLFDPKRFAA